MILKEKEILARLEQGDSLSRTEVLQMAESFDTEVLCRLGGQVRDRFAGRFFDTCSIVNARSGRCTEDCKWCAQSARFPTAVDPYELLPEEECVALARKNAACGVRKFSFVTSGRSLPDHLVDALCRYARRIREELPAMQLCASLGLMDEPALRRLHAAGITRFHCNLEAAPRVFPTLCTTHTIEEKMASIRAARAVGMEVCSGGIIGMGETLADRIDLALAVRSLDVKSVPLNILNPIPGTPLEKAVPLSDTDILTTAALFRLLLPDAAIRLAGGRVLIGHLEERMVAAGVNAAIVGDMLTTPGSKVQEDMRNFAGWGFEI